MTVIEYVTEEVKRQGHDIHALDGIKRVSWMLKAWSWALELSAASTERPTMKDAIELGRIVEPGKNRSGLRRVRVRVGDRICPEPDTVYDSLNNLFEHGAALTPIEFYKAFEMIHPFVDGNGRVGKILLAWLDGNLLNPYFPPADLFGHPVRNP